MRKDLTLAIELYYVPVGSDTCAFFRNALMDKTRRRIKKVPPRRWWVRLGGREEKKLFPLGKLHICAQLILDLGMNHN